MSYERDRAKEAKAQAFAYAFLTLAGQAQALGLDDYADICDALFDGAVTRLGLAESPIPGVPA